MVGARADVKVPFLTPMTAGSVIAPLAAWLLAPVCEEVPESRLGQRPSFCTICSEPSRRGRASLMAQRSIGNGLARPSRNSNSATLATFWRQRWNDEEHAKIMI